MTTSRIMAVLIGWIGVANGCAESGEGTLRVSIYGEEFVEQGIPATEVVDGWSIEFSKFLVSVESIAADGAALEGRFVYALTEPSNGAGHQVGTITVPAGTVEHLEYRVGLSHESTAGNAVAADIQLLNSTASSVYVAGIAQRNAESITFAWGFGTETRYVDCHTDQDVPDGGQATSQITIHGDHLFYDDLDLPEPDVTFDLIASADANANGDVTEEELRAVDITGETNYQVGSRDITDLWGFMAAQSTTMGHIDGEGHCETEP